MSAGGPGDQYGSRYPGFQGDPMSYPGHGYPGGQSGGYPPPDRSPWSSPVVLVAAAAGVLLVIGGVLAAFLLIPSDDDDPVSAPGTSTTTSTVTGSPGERADSPTVTITPPPTTVTTTHQPTTTGTRPAPTVPGADWQGFTDGPRCDAANDPAVAILRTDRSRMIICRVGEAGGLYYKGVADGNLKHIDFPTQEGKYFIARSGSYEYIVTPSGLVIRQNGNTIADEPAIAYWSR